MKLLRIEEEGYAVPKHSEVEGLCSTLTSV